MTIQDLIDRLNEFPDKSLKVFLTDQWEDENEIEWFDDYGNRIVIS